jgi:hypothetical protein
MMNNDKSNAYVHMDHQGRTRDATKDIEHEHESLIEDLSKLPPSLQIGQLQASSTISAKRMADAMEMIAHLLLVLAGPQLMAQKVKETTREAMKAPPEHHEEVFGGLKTMLDAALGLHAPGSKGEPTVIGAQVVNERDGSTRTIHIKSREQFKRLMASLEDGTFDPDKF